MRTGLALSLIFFSLQAGAVVDMKTANFAESWVDLVAPGIGYDLRIQRTYNSRTIFSGVFGFGWCSDLESKLEITPEGNIRVIECGAGAEVLYLPKKFDPKKIDTTVGSIMAEVRKRNPGMSDKALKDVQKDLEQDDYFREQFANRLGIKGSAGKDTIYFASSRENENVSRVTEGFKRTLGDGTYQMFDPNGRLIAMYDRNNNWLKLIYEKNRIGGVTDNGGRRLTFTYQATGGKIKKIAGPNNMSVSYAFKGEDLVEVTDSAKMTYKYAYDDVHNLTKITAPDGKVKALTYNKDKDWVVAFQNEKGCTEKYDYKINADNPRGHYKSTVVKMCGGKITNESTYEFFHQPKADGTGMFLYRVRSDINGQLTDIVYHDVFGKPVSILRSGYKTEYSYYDTGLIKQKREDARISNFEYKNSCNKVSRLDVEFYDANSGKKKGEKAKVVRRVQTKFNYDPKKCNLMYAENSDGQTVKLQYDGNGRISAIEDQSKKIVKIKYDDKFGKPETVTRPGLGTIRVSYKGDGEIKSVDSKEGPMIAVQVATIFNNLLELIGQASAESSL